MAHSHSIRKMLGIKNQNIHLENRTTEEVIHQVNSQVFYGLLTYTYKGW